LTSSRLVVAVAACACLTAPGPSPAAEFAPSPPCAGQPVAAQTAAGSQPSVKVWHAPASSEGWQLAGCSGLVPPGHAVLVETSGRFWHEGDALSVLARIGTVSEHAGIRYWSVRAADWRSLLVDASALSGPDPKLRRPDFGLDEMRPGAVLHMLYDDDEEPGPVVFATVVREAGPDGFVTVTRNVTAMRLMGLSIADPGDLSSMLSVQRVGPDEFAYYALAAVALAPMAAAMVSDAVHTNRAVASFRYVAGIPGDRDPPAMLK
jgi:hypothetical protein